MLRRRQGRVSPSALRRHGIAGQMLSGAQNCVSRMFLARSLVPQTPMRLLCLAALIRALFDASAALGADPQTVDPAKMPRVATVDERYLSYNVEMAELTGGLFWKPYDEIAAMKAQ